MHAPKARRKILTFIFGIKPPFYSWTSGASEKENEATKKSKVKESKNKKLTCPVPFTRRKDEEKEIGRRRLIHYI